MKIFIVFVRIVFGGILLLFGLNGLFNFFPLPETTVVSAAFQQSLWKTGYLMHLVKSIEVLTAIALLSNRFVPLFSIMFIPVSINIFLVDVFLQPQFGLMGYLILGLNFILIYYHRSQYVHLLKSGVIQTDDQASHNQQP